MTSCILGSQQEEIALATEENDFDIGSYLPDLCSHLNPIQSWHYQVVNDEIQALFPELLNPARPSMAVRIRALAYLKLSAFCSRFRTSVLSSTTSIFKRLIVHYLLLNLFEQDMHKVTTYYAASA